VNLVLFLKPSVTKNEGIIWILQNWKVLITWLEQWQIKKVIAASTIEKGLKKKLLPKQIGGVKEGPLPNSPSTVDNLFQALHSR
jgi:hypothetical protein